VRDAERAVTLGVASLPAAPSAAKKKL